ncbi:MAG: ABC transporter ATP-binding protein [Phenylobacterium sp.]
MLSPKRILRDRWDATPMRALRLAAAVTGWRFPTVVALVIAGAVLPALEMLALGALVGSLPATLHAGLGSGSGRGTLLALGAWGGLMLLLQVAPRLRTAVATAMGWRLDSHLRQRAMAAVNRPWGIAHLEDAAVADLISQVNAGIGVVGLTPGAALTQLIGTRYAITLGGLASGALLVGYHWWAALLLLVVIVAFSAISRRSYVSQAQTMLSQTASVRRAQYFRDLALAPAAAKDVRLLGLGGWIADRLRGEWRSGLATQSTARRRAFAATLAASTAVMLANILVYGLLASDAAGGAISLAALVVYVRAVMGLGALGSLGPADHIIAHGFAALPAILELEARTAAPSGPPLARLAPAAPEREICFERLSFTYPGAATPVLKGLDLTIPAGTSMALVGLNGAGKTTLVKLLARLYDPTEGAVRVDGSDLRGIEPADWQRRIAAIFQDFLRYGLPARDNVGFGGLSMTHDQPALDRAAAKAGVLDRIQALPMGWDTPLSRHFTGGADLSGGEWQRIALARALFAVEAGAKVLILDEPTANLDVRAEAELYDRFLDLTRGLTTLLISHRFSTVRRADRICVLEGGKAIELGSHAELMARGGRYAEMFTLQSQRFVGAVEGAGA